MPETPAIHNITQPSVFGEVFRKQTFVPFLLYLFVNSLFVLKYVAKTSYSPLIALIFYVLIISGVFLFANSRYWIQLNEKHFKILTIGALLLIISGIVFLLIRVDPYSVRVDRWSAVTFFLDSLLQGNYPYAAHTHVSSTNFPSPFPVWYVINLPFYLLGDVGYGLIAFIIVTTILVWNLLKSYKGTFLFVLFFALSPAYWWEVLVRSDSLSNAFLVFGMIVWFYVKGFTLKDNFRTAVVICGIAAATRLSAVLPLALFFFKPYTGLDIKHKIAFPTVILFFVFIAFSPFIFWEGGIFFQRNPFMSQTSVGSPYILLAMVLLGIFMALRIDNLEKFFLQVQLFMFVFILASQIGLIVTRGIQGSIFADSTYDISYFSLLLPYAVISLSGFSPKQRTIH